jgi:hypothetical protein
MRPLYEFEQSKNDFSYTTEVSPAGSIRYTKGFSKVKKLENPRRQEPILKPAHL